jgi:hypothetical protein
MEASPMSANGHDDMGRLDGATVVITGATHRAIDVLVNKAAIFAGLGGKSADRAASAPQPGALSAPARRAAT